MLGPSPSHSQTPADPKSTLKFLYSYGGKILPRHPDGKLRYRGGHSRVLAVPGSIPFSELLVKLEELCGSPVTHLRCQLPTDDLDALVSVTSDEDLANLIEEYDRVASLKIRAFLSPPVSFNKVSSPSSPSSLSKSSSSSSSSSSFRSPTGSGGGCNPTYTVVPPVVQRCLHQMLLPTAYPAGMEKYAVTGRNILLPYYAYHAQCQGSPGLVYLIHKAKLLAIAPESFDFIHG